MKNNRKQFENGTKGGAPKRNKNAIKNNPNSTQIQPENNPKTTYKDKDKDKDKEINKEKSTNVDIKKTAQRFSRPSLDDIKNYIALKSYSVDAEAFYDFYEAKGWKVGNNAMKDWQAAVRTWERRNKANREANPQKNTAIPDGCKLGVGEYIDGSGRRTYGTGRANIPMTAAPRPSERYSWDAASNSWIYS